MSVGYISKQPVGATWANPGRSSHPFSHVDPQQEEEKNYRVRAIQELASYNLSCLANSQTGDQLNFKASGQGYKPFTPSSILHDTDSKINEFIYNCLRRYHATWKERGYTGAFRGVSDSVLANIVMAIHSNQYGDIYNPFSPTHITLDHVRECQNIYLRSIGFFTHQKMYDLVEHYLNKNILSDCHQLAKDIHQYGKIAYGQIYNPQGIAIFARKRQEIKLKTFLGKDDPYSPLHLALFSHFLDTYMKKAKHYPLSEINLETVIKESYEVTKKSGFERNPCFNLSGFEQLMQQNPKYQEIMQGIQKQRAAQKHAQAKQTALLKKIEEKKARAEARAAAKSNSSGSDSDIDESDDDFDVDDIPNINQNGAAQENLSDEMLRKKLLALIKLAEILGPQVNETPYPLFTFMYRHVLCGASFQNSEQLLTQVGQRYIQASTFYKENEAKIRLDFNSHLQLSLQFQQNRGRGHAMTAGLERTSPYFHLYNQEIQRNNQVKEAELMNFALEARELKPLPPGTICFATLCFGFYVARMGMSNKFITQPEADPFRYNRY